MKAVNKTVAAALEDRRKLAGIQKILEDSISRALGFSVRLSYNEDYDAFKPLVDSTLYAERKELSKFPVPLSVAVYAAISSLTGEEEMIVTPDEAPSGELFDLNISLRESARVFWSMYQSVLNEDSYPRLKVFRDYDFLRQTRLVEELFGEGGYLSGYVQRLLPLSEIVSYQPVMSGASGESVFFWVIPTFLPKENLEDYGVGSFSHKEKDIEFLKEAISSLIQECPKEEPLFLGNSKHLSEARVVLLVYKPDLALSLSASSPL